MKSKSQIQMAADKIAFNKLYFINLFYQNNKFRSYYEAEILIAPKLKAVIEKLTPNELEYLIDKIESL